MMLMQDSGYRDLVVAAALHTIAVSPTIRKSMVDTAMLSTDMEEQILSHTAMATSVRINCANDRHRFA